MNIFIDPKGRFLKRITFKSSVFFLPLKACTCIETVHRTGSIVCRRFTQDKRALNCCFRIKSITYKCLKGSVLVEKPKKNVPLSNLIFCHKLSLLDWIMVIWAIFGLPGPFGGSGEPMWGLGGLAKTKFSNFHMRPFLALRCHLLDLTSFKHYDFGFLGQNWGLVAEKKPFLAKIGYMQKWIFLKNISSNFVYIAPK